MNMSETTTLPSSTSAGEKRAKTGAQRQAALRQKMLAAGKRQFSFWLTEKESNQIQALLDGAHMKAVGNIEQELARLTTWSEQLAEEARQLRARRSELDGLVAAQPQLVKERDELADALQKSRLQNHDLLDDLGERAKEAIQLHQEIREFRAKLQQAERALKEKPAKTFKVPELPDRRVVIAKAMSTDGWANKENAPHQLKAKADLAKKFSAEIKNAHSRLAGLVGIAYGVELLEQSKSRSTFGGYQKFAAPIISEAEKALLLGACAVLRHIEHDVERAGSDVDKLHKQREAEHKERVKQAEAALNKALFDGMDRRSEVLFVAAMHPGNQGWGSWSDLVDAASGRGSLYEAAMEVFRKALKDEKSSLIGRVADAMKNEGKTAEELACGIAEKYRHPDTEEKFGEITNRVTMFLVSERIAKS